uniref:Uncharacterized protein n=1 Tax=Heterorhabditis bacteriophora TaxID=37862 RepID=A0A1I7X039_HETBA
MLIEARNNVKAKDQCGKSNSKTHNVLGVCRLELRRPTYFWRSLSTCEYCILLVIHKKLPNIIA